MTALVILAAVVLALVLLGQIPPGSGGGLHRPGSVRARQGRASADSGLSAAAQAGEAAKAEKEEKEPDKPKEKASPLAQLRQYLPLITDAAGRLKRKIRIDSFTLEFTAAASDPRRRP